MQLWEVSRESPYRPPPPARAALLAAAQACSCRASLAVSVTWLWASADALRITCESCASDWRVISPALAHNRRRSCQLVAYALYCDVDCLIALDSLHRFAFYSVRNGNKGCNVASFSLLNYPVSNLAGKPSTLCQ